MAPAREPPVGLLELPDEILQNILLDLPSSSVIACVKTCKRFAAASNFAQLWKKLCLHRYRYWQHPPNSSGVSGWKHFLQQRKADDCDFQRLFESAIRNQTGRITNLETIGRSMYNAKDYLLHQFDTPPDADDYLARTYWASQLLGSVERHAAVAEWMDVFLRHKTQDLDYPLERLFGALDMFIADRPPESLNELGLHLDNITQHFVDDLHPALSCNTKSTRGTEPYTIRKLATRLTHFLSRHELTGINTQHHSYRNLQNNLITVALCQKHHPSLPLVSCVIYCSIARRLGLRAHLCNFPFHIICRISAPEGLEIDNPEDFQRLRVSFKDFPMTSKDLDEMRKDPLEEAREVAGHEYVYVDPFNTVCDIPESDLLEELSHVPTHRMNPAQLRQHFLTPSLPTNFLLRTANNISNALNRGYRSQYSTAMSEVDSAFIPDHILPNLRPVTIDPNRALYCALMLDVIFSDIIPEGPEAFRHEFFVQHLSHQLDRFILDQPWLESLIEWLSPRFIRGAGTVAVMRERLETTKLDYQHVPRPKCRHQRSIESGEVLQDPKYTIGTLFHHARYNYQGVIVGWDRVCQASEAWIAHMGVDGLAGGRGQVFYNVVSADETMRYVAEENINATIADDRFLPHENLMRMAGRWFKRWEVGQKKFVSNVRESYPDD